MPKFPPIPRLSIVVPVGRDLAGFESTLISVLENHPGDCEVLVCHDGRYNDPFELCDEVRFVVAESDCFVDLVAAGAAQARGRFVHVLADGVRATPDWIDEALEKFEHFDCGVVAPVIRNAETDEIVSAGWCDSIDRLCGNACEGREEIGEKAPQMIGAHLPASFWRRELLRSLSDAFLGRQTVEATYAYEHLSRAAGWRCVLASESELLIDTPLLPWHHPSVGRGMRLQAIRNHFHRGGWTRSISAASFATVTNVARPGCAMESIGRAFAPAVAAKLTKQLSPEEVASCHDQELIVSMHRHCNTRQQTLRRAA